MRSFDEITRVIDLVPGTVQALESIEAERLSPAVFWSDFVCRHRPLIIKGGARHWKAAGSWGQVGYLETLAPTTHVVLSRTYNPVPITRAMFDAMGRGPMVDCLAEMRAAPDDATYSMLAVRVSVEWEADLGQYPFLSTENDKLPYQYPRRRLFIYRNASTEWHYHQTDETLTTQLSGTKRVSLFRLTPENWDAYQPVIAGNLHHLPCGKRFFPNDMALSKHEGLLEPGDVAYIPPYWWHGVDPADSTLGVTLAHCFCSPLARFGDWRDPISREMLPEKPWRDFRQLVGVSARMTLSTAIRTVRGERWYTTSTY